MFSFAYPWLLLLFLPFAGLLVYIWRRPLPTLKISTIRSFKASGGSRLRPAVIVPRIIFSLALAVLILALARPRYGDEKVIMRALGIDIMLALDVSGSMEVIDVPSDIKSHNELINSIKSGKVSRRIDVAKEEIGKFIDKRLNDRIGLIAFADLPYNVSPPTLDHAWLIQNMKRLEPGSIGNRTGIAGPVASAVQRLKDSESKRRVIVLFTDGSNNVEARLTPRQAAELAAQFDVVVYTVGIGSNSAYILQRDNFFGDRFVPIRDDFDEALLKDMAKISGGKYYHASDAEGLEKAMEEINKLEKTSIEQPRHIEYSEFGPQLAIAALILLLTGILLDRTIFLKVP
jgi:Ca-activated chloride channel family protein